MVEVRLRAEVGRTPPGTQSYSIHLFSFNMCGLVFVTLRAASVVFAMSLTLAINMEDNRIHPVPPDSLPGSHGIYYNSRYLQHDTLLSDLIRERKKERYFFTIQDKSANTVSATVMPCTSRLNWTILYRPFTDEEDDIEEMILKTYYNKDTTTTYHQENSPKGIYIIEVEAVERQSYVKFFVSTETIVDPKYWETFDSNITLIRGEDNERLKYHQLTFKWRSSLIRPYDMHYCLVINRNRSYNTLCEAQGNQFGVPYTINSSHMDMHKRSRGYSRGEVIMGCVGRRTKYKISLRDLNNNKKYYFDLFILDKSTSLSYLYGRESFYPKERIPPIEDGKRKATKLRRKKSCSTFKYKQEKHNSTIYVITDVCTGSVSTTAIKQKKQKGSTVKKLTEWKADYTEDHSTITIPNAVNGTYKIKVCRKRDDKKIHRAKLMVTTNKLETRFHMLPNDTEITVTTLNCDSATIKWVSSPDPESQRYCVLVWKDDQDHPNYCKTNKPQCDIKQLTADSWATENIGNLERGHKYRVQVQVYKNKPKRIPPRNYQTISIEAHPYCMSSRNFVNSNNIRRG